MLTVLLFIKLILIIEENSLLLPCLMNRVNDGLYDSELWLIRRPGKTGLVSAEVMFHEVG